MLRSLPIHMPIAEFLWVSFGLLGQIMFSLRFVLQWWASEKAKKTVIPFSFWVFSITGSAILTAYAIYRKDPVFILGQMPSVFIYSRNIMLAKAAEKKERQNTGIEA